jgi:hypothetical protein
MTGFGDIPRAELIKLGNVNRLKAAGIAFDRPEIGMLLKVQFQNGRVETCLVPATNAVLFAEHIDKAARLRGWRAMAPAALEITDADWANIAAHPDGGNVTGGHVVALEDAIILVLGFRTNLGLCLRVGRNHAAWFADQVLRARDQGLLRDIRGDVPAPGRPH